MKEPTNIKGVQQLSGRVGALSRFIAKLCEKTLPFYKQLRKADMFEWTQEACDAFQALKRTLSTSPVLVAPQEKERMYLYIVATREVVSTILGVERPEEGSIYGVQRPVYYLSEVLSS
jgi:dsDNA-binding SOS-regulon protein